MESVIPLRGFTHPIEQFALPIIADRDRSFLAALGPGRLEQDVIAVVGIGRLEFDGFLSAQPEKPLQFEGQSHERVLDFLEIGLDQFLGLAHIGHERAAADAVMGVVFRDEVRLVDLPGPPTQGAHAVLEGAVRQALFLPVLHERLDMLGLQRGDLQVAIPDVVQLIGDHGQLPGTIVLHGAGAVPIAIAHLFELVVQFANWQNSGAIFVC